MHDDPEAGGEDEELALAHLDALVADDGELDVAEDREDAHVEHVDHARDDVAAVVDRLDEHRLGEEPLELVEDEVVGGRELAGQVDVEEVADAAEER